MSTSSSKTIILKSTKGELFEIEEEAAKLSPVLEPLIENGCVKPYIPIPNVNKHILSKVVEFCQMYIKVVKKDGGKVKSLIKLYVNEDERSLFDLQKAAHYLDIEDMFMLVSRVLLDKLKEKTADEMREFVDVDAINDLSPRRVAALRAVLPKAFN
ncbi:SKP1 component [Artemisia annua]|uniref:SKP1-like protein n=1 Tax=Artemisia annua TaxID=35608 RepID=A0A2U1PEA0_ARTAN|nr:SKP1 component [Artemisia annua]